MDNQKRFNQIENLLTDLLKGQDRQTLVIDRMLTVLVEQGQTMKGIQEQVAGISNDMKEVRDEIRGLRQDIGKMAEYEARFRTIESRLDRLGA